MMLNNKREAQQARGKETEPSSTMSWSRYSILEQILNLDTQEKINEARSMKSAFKPKEKKKSRIGDIIRTKNSVKWAMRFRPTFDTIPEAELRQPASIEEYL